MILTPIIFITVISLGFSASGNSVQNAEYPIGIVNNDNGIYSKILIKMMKDDKYFKVTQSNISKSRKDVENGKINMCFVIPGDFSDAIENGRLSKIDIIRTENNENTSAFFAVIQNYICQIKTGVRFKKKFLNVLDSTKLMDRKDESSVENNIENDYFKNIKFQRNGYTMSAVQDDGSRDKIELSNSAIGIIVMFVMFFVTIGAGSFLEERENGTFLKLKSMPVKSLSIFSGYLIGNFIVGWIETAVIIIFSRYVFNIDWGSSLIGIIILFSCFLLCATGLGTTLSSIVKTKSQLMIISPLVVIPTSLLGGCMWPKDIMSPVMLKIAEFMPQSWVIQGMSDLITRNGCVSAVYIPSLVLVSFTIVFFMLGIVLMNLQKE